jgi:Domain found in Dishevelled, Egl-10, and Pleckstrin (DEP)
MVSKESKPVLHVALPAGVSHGTVTALANAVGLSTFPLHQSMSSDSDLVATVLERFRESAHNFFLIDLSQVLEGGLSLLNFADKLGSSQARKRIFLSNVQGQVSHASQALARDLGFVDLVADFDPKDAQGSLRPLSDWVCSLMPEAREKLRRLPAFLKTVSLQSTFEGPRQHIQRLTGLSAEALTIDITKQVEVRDRTYRLKVFPHCFLGTEATHFLCRKFRLAQQQAVSVGQALQQLGLIVHVAHEQAFANEAYFYRLAMSFLADQMPLAKAWRKLSTRLEIKDRTYLGKNYPACFTGTEAVDLACESLSLNRVDAWIVLHRLQLLGLFQHVSQEHGMIDGHFYYRLTDSATTASVH